MKRFHNKLNCFFVIILILFSSCKSIKPNADNTINLPELNSFVCDGNDQEWSKVESYRLWANPFGGYPETNDLKVNLKISRKENTLFLLLDITDDDFKSDTISPWNGDAIEVFLSPSKVSEYIFQAAITSDNSKDRIKITEYNRDSTKRYFSKDIQSVSKFENNRRLTEIAISLDENASASFAMQVYVDDSDSDNSKKNQVVWYPIGQSYNTSSSMYTIRKSPEIQKPILASSRLVISDNTKIDLLVFGAQKGQKINIYQGNKLFSSQISNHQFDYQPDSIDISSSVWDIENDSLYVFIDKQQINFYQLYLAPRRFIQLKEKKFDRDIRNFVNRDRQIPPPQNASLFIGSSSIVYWESLIQDFPELTIIKRGFGGSNSQEALLYINQIALPYKPSRIVYYEGDNDVAQGVSPDTILKNVELFITEIIKNLPTTNIYILSPKPSIKRMHLWKEYQQTHKLLQTLPAKYATVKYVDVSSIMFTNKELDSSLFIADGIHMNAKGYALWTKILRKELELDN